MHPVKNLLLFVITIRRNNDRDRFLDRFFRRVTEETFRPGIPTGNDSVEVFANNRVAGRLNDRRQLPARFFAAFAIRDVAQIGGKNRRVVDLDRGDGQFDQNFRTIFANADDFDPLADDRPFSGLEIFREAATVLFAQTRRNY